MQSLHLELRLGLEFDEPHGRARGRFSDCLGISVIILLSLHIGSHILGRHQPHRVALIRQQPAQQVGAATGLHCHDAGRQLGGICDHRRPPHPAPQDDGTCIIQSDQTAHRLAQIDPKNSYGHGSLLFSACTGDAMRSGSGGAGHSIRA